MSATVTDDGVHIAYSAWGRRDSSPVLLIQGLGVDSRGWALQRGAFGRHHRCIALDNRGTGRSDAPPAPTTSAVWPTTRSRFSTPRESNGRTSSARRWAV